VRRIFWDNQRLVYNSDMDAAKEKGRMTSQEEIARNMMARGYKSEEIRAITGLSSEEIDKLS
jgi:SOS response regulatory protein OraA/RecX